MVQYGPDLSPPPSSYSCFLQVLGDRKIGLVGLVTFNWSNPTPHFDAVIALVIGSALCCVVLLDQLG